MGRRNFCCLPFALFWFLQRCLLGIFQLWFLKKVSVNAKGSYRRRFLMFRKSGSYGTFGILNNVKLTNLGTLLNMCQSFVGFVILQNSHYNSVLFTKVKQRPKLDT